MRLGTWCVEPIACRAKSLSIGICIKVTKISNWLEVVICIWTCTYRHM